MTDVAKIEDYRVRQREGAYWLEAGRRNENGRMIWTAFKRFHSPRWARIALLTHRSKLATDLNRETR